MRYNKYNNKKTEVDGYTFASIKEAMRYQELKLLEKAGRIFNLELQPKFELVPKTAKRREVNYVADFGYIEKDGDTLTIVVEDVKGYRTKEYIIKRNLFEYQNPDIDFREV